MNIQRIQRRPEDLSPDTRTKLDEVIAAAKRQEELIADAVEYDQAAVVGLAGDTPIPLRLAIQGAMMKLEVLRKSSSGLIAFDPEAIPCAVVAPGVTRIVEKLLHNSLKFVPAGASPVVRIEVSEEPSSAHLTIRIHDQGIGIEPQYYEAVFEPFKRLNPASQYPGSGLGLSICRRLAESIHGSVQVMNNGPVGTTVAVSIPKLD